MPSSDAPLQPLRERPLTSANGYAAALAGTLLISGRQQAEAIISARSRIVHGAFSLVEDALEVLSERRIVQPDAERKAAMVSNLLVVLCSDKDTQPTLNAGTLYS